MRQLDLAKGRRSVQNERRTGAVSAPNLRPGAAAGNPFDPAPGLDYSAAVPTPVAGRPALIGSLLLLLCLFVAPTPSLPAAPLLAPPDSLRSGQPLLGYTVFQGTRVDTFRLEFLAVLPGGAADGDLLLARGTDARLDSIGIVAGMSGSPITTLDGRLVGALAYGWAFASEPICGITPIGEMLALWEDAAEPSGPGSPRGSERKTHRPADREDGLRLLRTPISVAGVPEEVLAWHREADQTPLVRRFVEMVPAPLLGQHTAQVLATEIGLSAAEIADLAASGVLQCG